MLRSTSKPLVRLPLVSTHDVWVTFGISVVVFLFYWGHVRPSIVYRTCNRHAEEAALSVLSAKAALSSDLENSNEYLRMLKAGLYMKEDYEFAFRRCIRGQGLSW